MSPFLHEHQIIHNTQFGFQPRHSMMHLINQFINTIATVLGIKTFCTGLFLDIAKQDKQLTEYAFKIKKNHNIPIFLNFKIIFRK